jgi:hypothetical protein
MPVETSPRARWLLDAIRISIRALDRTSILAWTKPCTILLGRYPRCGMHHGSDKHLAYDDMTNLDCCEVMAITIDYGMTNITLDNLYFVLSCRPTPPNALSMQYGWRTDSEGTNTLSRPYLHQEWALRHFGPGLLVGFWCENTYNMGSPDLSSSRNGPTPGTWHMACPQHLSQRSWHLAWEHGCYT